MGAPDDLGDDGRVRPLRLTLWTWGFRTPTFMSGVVEMLSEVGVDVSVVVARVGDGEFDPQPAAKAAGSFRLVPAPFELPWRRRPTAATSAVARAAVHNPTALGRLVRTLAGQRHSLRRFLGRLYLDAPLLSRPADVIHLGWLGYAVNQTAVIDASRDPVVVSCHGSDLRILPYSHPSFPAAIRRVFERVDLVHCVSEDLAERAMEFGADANRLFVGSWGVDTRSFTPHPAVLQGEGPIRIVTVARLHPVKDLDTSLAAVAALRRSGADIHYTIVGSGPPTEVSRLQREARRRGIGDRVDVRGIRSQREVSSILGRSDIFLLTSLSEGLNVATLEAMASGVPVVVTDVGGMAEAVTDQVDGLLVAPGDVAATTHALQSLVRDPDGARALARAARQRVVMEFDSRVCIRRITRHYEDLVVGRNPLPSHRSSVGSFR